MGALAFLLSGVTTPRQTTFRVLHDRAVQQCTFDMCCCCASRQYKHVHCLDDKYFRQTVKHDIEYEFLPFLSVSKCLNPYMDEFSKSLRFLTSHGLYNNNIFTFKKKFGRIILRLDEAYVCNKTPWNQIPQGVVFSFAWRPRMTVPWSPRRLNDRPRELAI